jgi:hypothetical protein
VARREHGPGAAEDDDADLVVGLGAQERVVELDEHPAVLGVARLGPVQQDACDLPVVERLVDEELLVGHRGVLRPGCLPKGDTTVRRTSGSGF